MYTIEIPLSVYHHWIPDLGSMKMSTTEYFISTYPEIVSTQYHNGKDSREFVFESEEHYHWFLLKVQ
jgi:hypothetical protein